MVFYAYLEEVLERKIINSKTTNRLSACVLSSSKRPEVDEVRLNLVISQSFSQNFAKYEKGHMILKINRRLQERVHCWNVLQKGP